MVLAVSYALNAQPNAGQHLQTPACSELDKTTTVSAATASDSSCGNAGSSCASRGYGRNVRSNENMHSCSSSNNSSNNSQQAEMTAVRVVGMYASPSQKRLAEITEMIHTASLFHDDVIDKV